MERSIVRAIGAGNRTADIAAKGDDIKSTTEMTAAVLHEFVQEA